jgi:antitoxin CcdA
VNSDLRARARELGVNLRRRLRETWLEENREGIEAYNELVAQHGVFSIGLRGF